MELTGKCKEAFDEWLTDVHYKRRHDAFFHWVGCTETMQYGVYVDFFDSVGIHIESSGLNAYVIEYFYNIQEEKTLNGINGFSFKTRENARKQSIKEAMEIFNKR